MQKSTTNEVERPSTGDGVLGPYIRQVDDSRIRCTLTGPSHRLHYDTRYETNTSADLLRPNRDFPDTNRLHNETVAVIVVSDRL